MHICPGPSKFLGPDRRLLFILVLTPRRIGLRSGRGRLLEVESRVLRGARLDQLYMLIKRYKHFSSVLALSLVFRCPWPRAIDVCLSLDLQTHVAPSFIPTAEMKDVQRDGSFPDEEEDFEPLQWAFLPHASSCKFCCSEPTEPVQSERWEYCAIAYPR